MTQVKTPLPKGAVKVSRVIAQALATLTEVRESYNSLKKQTEDIRKSVLAEVGEDESSVLYHNGVVVGSVEVREGQTVDTKKLELLYPEAYKACLKPSKRVTLKTN